MADILAETGRSTATTYHFRSPPGCAAAVSTGQRRVCDARAEAAGAGGWHTVDEPGAKWPGRQLVVRKDYCPDCGAAALARIA